MFESCLENVGKTVKCKATHNHISRELFTINHRNLGLIILNSINIDLQSFVIHIILLFDLLTTAIY